MAITWDRNEIQKRYLFQANYARHSKEGYVKLSDVCLHPIDLILTVLASNAGFTELNPIMKGMLDSPLELLLVKFIVPLFIAWLVPGKLLLPAILLLTVVVGWNMKELLFLML